MILQGDVPIQPVPMTDFSNNWIIPRPDRNTTALFENTNRNSLLFLRAAKINPGSRKHKDLKTTIQALRRQYLDPYKYVEEEAPDRVERLIAKAQISLPWLYEYEDCWPARIYLKRYVDTRRPHLRLKHSMYAQAAAKMHTSHPTHEMFMTNPGLKDPDRMLVDDNHLTVREFLATLTPSLEHHLDAFVELGIKDQTTLHAFLTWPQAVQAQFLDEGHGVLRLTSLERRGLLVDCGLASQKALKRSQVGSLRL